mmetsp:Transcript_2502/g.7113  ORF Transcript_2502/g.7113 Transcript_2502/m.7113 type:complete len:261 (-) Transcript_2502:510-1292(-)
MDEGRPQSLRCPGAGGRDPGVPRGPLHDPERVVLRPRDGPGSAAGRGHSRYGGGARRQDHVRWSAHEKHRNALRQRLAQGSLQGPRRQLSPARPHERHRHVPRWEEAPAHSAEAGPRAPRRPVFWLWHHRPRPLRESEARRQGLRGEQPLAEGVVGGGDRHGGRELQDRRLHRLLDVLGLCRGERGGDRPCLADEARRARVVLQCGELRCGGADEVPGEAVPPVVGLDSQVLPARAQHGRVLRRKVEEGLEQEPREGQEG